jgi:hypothetical protein
VALPPFALGLPPSTVHPDLCVSECTDLRGEGDKGQPEGSRLAVRCPCRQLALPRCVSQSAPQILHESCPTRGDRHVFRPRARIFRCEWRRNNCLRCSDSGPLRSPGLEPARVNLTPAHPRHVRLGAVYSHITTRTPNVCDQANVFTYDALVQYFSEQPCEIRWTV